MSETLPKLHSVADHLGVSLKTMWRLINSRQITFTKINRRVLISTDAMNEFIQARIVDKLDPNASREILCTADGIDTPHIS